MTDRRERTLAVSALGAVVAWHAALLFVQVRHPEPFLNDSVLHFGLIRALASAPARGQSFLDPWVPTWGLGFPVFHYYQNLPHLIVVAVWKASLGALRLVEAFQIVSWLAVVTLPIAVYLGVRKLGFGRAGAVAAGTLSLWIRTDYLHGLDLESYTWQGLGQFTQSVGGWFLPLAIAWTVVAVRDGRGFGLAALFMTLALLSHFALGYMALMAAGLFALLAPREIPRRLVRVALVAATTIAASAYVVVPIFRDFAYYNVSTLVPSWKYHSFGHAVVLGRLVRGELFDFGRAPVLSVLVGIGVVVAAFRARRDERSRFLLAVFAFFLLLYFGRPTWGKLLDALPLGSGFHYSRALYLVHQAGAMLAGVAAADLLQRLARVSRLGAATAVAAGVLVAAPIATERMAYLLRNAGLLQEAARSYAAERADLEAALALAREDRLGRTYAGFGRPGGPPWGGAFMVGWVPVYSWLPIREIDALGYLHHMWSLNADVHDGFDERRPDHYRVFNVRRILAPEGVATAPFAEPLARFGRFRVLAVEGPGYVELVDAPYVVNVPKRNVSRLHRAWLAGPFPAAGIHPAVRLLEEGAPIAGAYLADGADVRLPQAEPPATPRGEVLSVERRGEDFLAEVRVDRPCHLLLKVSFHPGWRALVDGDRAETVQLLPSYVGVPLAPGTHRVELSWEPGPLKSWLLAAGLLALAATFGVERRREAGAGPSGWKRRLARVPWSVETYKLLKNARYAVRSRLRTEGGIHKGGMSHAEAVAYVEGIFRAFDKEIGGWAGQRVLECGPGDSLGVGVLALAKGAAAYRAIDRFPVSFHARRESAIFRDLLSALPPEERRRVEDVIVLSPDGYRVEGDRFEYFNSISLEEASRRFGARSFDVIFSNAVLEHVGDVASSLRSMREMLAPGGVMAHDVDLRSHQNFEKHELHFLEYSTALWRAMTSNTGEPNRVRLPEYRRILEDLGFTDVNIRVKSRFDPELVRRVRPRLARQFRALSDEDLSVAVFLVTARAPR